jgi:hypothetical protein
MKQKTVNLNLQKREEAWERGIRSREISETGSIGHQGSKRHAYKRPGGRRRK